METKDDKITKRERLTAHRKQKMHKPGFFRRTINGWFNRLLGAVHDGSLSEQHELYASNQTSRDYIWNSIGAGTWGAVFPILTIVVTQISGVEQAGMFSMAFVVGLLLMFIGNYGVRAYQVSDTEESHSFSDYQVNRLITSAAMLVIGIAYCLLRGYSEEMFLISMGVYFYKMIDGLADVYEGRLQQVGKLYLGGISQTLRSVLVIIVFSIFLLITRNLAASCIAMAVTSVLTLVVVTLPLALLETPKSRKLDTACIVSLFKQCFPLFIALFMFNLVDTMPKFVMEGTLSYDNQLYFNALYFPAQAILIGMQLVYRPQLVRMANLWCDTSKRKKFDLMIVVIIAAIIVLTGVVMVVMGWIGIPIMSFLYGVDFEEFRGLCYIMLVAGGVTAGIDFLYQVITVQRQQRSVTKLYLITFVFSMFIPVLLVSFTGLPGAVLSYLIIMSILFVLLLVEYAGIRFNIFRESAAQSAEQEKLRRPSERRAERERIASHRGEGMSKKSDKKK